MRYFILLLITINASFSQNYFDDIEDSFEDFAELSREQIYTHINKSTFVTGESIWFKTYVVLRDDMSMSNKTSNIYCSLYDSDDKIVKKKMLLAYGGVANGEFDIDSTLRSGEYALKCYTNWSKNFANEYVHYEAKLKLINPDDKVYDKPIDSNANIDVQLLAEGGHFLENTLNTVGIIAKDSLGKSVKNLRVKIFENQQLLKELQLNQLGIGVFNINPKPDAKYTASYYYYNTKFELPFPKTETNGVILQLKDLGDSVDVKVKTNSVSLNSLINQRFKLTIHNSVDITGYTFTFQNNLTQSFKIKAEDLYPGVNIFTLFDALGKPIAERIFFNYQGINLIKTKTVSYQKVNDSISIQLGLDSALNYKNQSLSASVLPSLTKSYNHNNNIVSSFLLTPYLKTPIENVNYFFKDISIKKQIELNEVLLTQGWSRYDWNTIINDQPEPIFDFEYGINYRISSNSKSQDDYIIYPNYNSKTELITISPNGFINKLGFFPFDDDKLRIGVIKKNGKVTQSNLVINFEQNEVPDFKTNYKELSINIGKQFTNQVDSMPSLSNLEKIQELEEVRLYKTKTYTRIEKLQNKRIGKIYDFDEKMKQQYRTFAQFISSHGYSVNTTKSEDADQSGGRSSLAKDLSLFKIETYSVATINGTREPRIFLNDVYLSDYNILNNFSMENVDYVEINKSGVGEGIRAAAGVIRIYTDPQKGKSITPTISFTEYNIPLSFTSPKTYYSPKYGSTQSQFYKEFGAVDWKPNLKLENGVINFKVNDIDGPIKIYLEGLINDNGLVSEIITID
ncbi:MAG: hypothetical protein ED556_10035 [Winogradskyella sp.]|uniref:hypothetical protein n=1 Tax=Winogradskyella sp. TaxID=1883156 RepID=UPI000F408831|nr:hypothetical protein [Winogradskyella sp.]RNC84913.1 MAG: hypothetical protein ED556_10035 [Winogradskyella sp.]